MRVIAGQFRGRVLKAPSGNQTRPTADRAREGLFSMLGTVTGFSVLDMYAGTGALGIEALSRGAAHAVFVESAAPALKSLHENVTSLQLQDRATIVGRPVERMRASLQSMAPFDLVLCDPPWRNIDSVWQMLDTFDWSQWLAPEGQLVLEHPANVLGALTTSHLEVSRTRAWGDSAVTLLHRRPTFSHA